MQIALFITAYIMMFLVVATILIQSYKEIQKNKLSKIRLEDIDIIGVCNNMIQYHELSNIQIVQHVNGINHYDPVKNRIILKEIKQPRLSDLIIATHEVGHYIDSKKNSFFTIIAIKTVVLTALNRLILIPFFIFNFFLSVIYLKKSYLSIPLGLIFFLAAIFYIISIIRVVCCIPVENNASRIAFEFMKMAELIKEENYISIKKFYLSAAFGQILMAISYISIITLIILLSIN